MGAPQSEEPLTAKGAKKSAKDAKTSQSRKGRVSLTGRNRCSEAMRPCLLSAIEF
jgi:hypothetical protein